MDRRYEVTKSDSFGRITRTESFGGGQLDEAIAYRREHPQSAGWTIYLDDDGYDRAHEAGLHAAPTRAGRQRV